MELFSLLKRKNKLNSYADFFDWLFDDKLHFKNWKSHAVSSFTKKVKKEFNEFSIVSSEEILIDQLNYKYNKGEMQVIIMNNGNSAGRDLIRHLRNSIAHSKIEMIQNKKVQWLKLTDYNKQSKRNTAYFIVKITTLLEIYNIYQDIQKAINNKFL